MFYVLLTMVIKHPPSSNTWLVEHMLAHEPPLDSSTDHKIKVSEANTIKAVKEFDMLTENDSTEKKRNKSHIMSDKWYFLNKHKSRAAMPIYLFSFPFIHCTLFESWIILTFSGPNLSP